MVDHIHVEVAAPPLESKSFNIDDELVLSLLLKVLSRIEVLAESTGDTETLLATAAAYLEVYDRLRFGSMAEEAFEQGEDYDEG